MNISSGAGLVGVPGYSGYAASKHAEIGLTKSTALDYGHPASASTLYARAWSTPP